MTEHIFLGMILMVAAIIVYRRVRKTLTVGEDGHVCDSCPLADPESMSRTRNSKPKHG